LPQAIEQFLMSLYLPRQALLLGLAIACAVTAALVAGQQMVVHPVDLGPLCREWPGLPHNAQLLARLNLLHHREWLPHPLT